MTAWYNEIEPYAAQWLRNLIAAGLIAPGVVDERPVEDVRPYELASFTQCHFFAGIGGWSCALRLAGVPDDRPLWTGSCPCQPFSAAGKRRGFADERHLWPFWRYLIAQRRPATVLGEQVARATDWLRLVRSDLEALDYAVGAIPVEAASAGADQLRDRYWFVAQCDSAIGDGQWAEQGWGQNGFADAGFNGVMLGNGNSTRLAFGSKPEIQRRDVREKGTPTGEAGNRSGDLGEPGSDGWPTATARHRYSAQPAGSLEWVRAADGKARRVEPGIRLLAHGVPQRVAKLRAFGNAIVPQVAAEFIKAAL